METNKCVHLCKCDFYGCSKPAVYSFAHGEKTGKQLHLCHQCMSELYGELGKILVPKAVENPIKRLRKKGD